MDVLKSCNGQAMVEFGLSIIVYLTFIFGLMGILMWGTLSFIAQEVAHESARKYAVTEDKLKSENLGEGYIKKWAFLFVDESNVNVIVSKNGNKAISNVSLKPKKAIENLFVFKMPLITKTSTATFEHYLRDSTRHEYEQS